MTTVALGGVPCEVVELSVREYLLEHEVAHDHTQGVAAEDVEEHVVPPAFPEVELIMSEDDLDELP